MYSSITNTFTVHPTITTTFNIFLALPYTFLNTSFFCRLSHYPDLLNILTFPATCDFFRMFTIIDGLGNLSAACLFFLRSYIFMLTYIPTTYRISPKDLLSCYVPYFPATCTDSWNINVFTLLLYFPFH